MDRAHAFFCCQNPCYFGKAFREYMNMTQKEYRIKKLEFSFHVVQ